MKIPLRSISLARKRISHMDPSEVSTDYIEGRLPAPMVRVNGNRTFVRHADRGNSRASTTPSFPGGHTGSRILNHRTSRFRRVGQRSRTTRSSHQSRHRWRQEDRVCPIEEPRKSNCRSETGVTLLVYFFRSARICPEQLQERAGSPRAGPVRRTLNA